ncbi:MAG: sulfur carrier protein ThiS [Gammaproteobacteria bacterium]|nr:sulfur carrier protein ThiS [Gammaproteobacteria bacterium]
MKIKINGELFDSEHKNLLAVVEKFGATPPFALAVNGDFVPKSLYQECELLDGDVVDIVSPIFGG